MKRRNYLLKILLKYGGVLESKNEAITEIEIINHLYDNRDKKTLKGFEQQQQCTKMKEEDLSMEDPVSHSSSPNTVHNKMLVNVHHSSDAASTNKSTDFADNQHGHDHCWELLLRYDDAQVGFAPGRFPQRKL